MGFYLRKSISVGPLRFNLSKSGIGVSAGVTGLRFGIGPRGNYVHMGLGGLFYRATAPISISPRKSSAKRFSLISPKVPAGTHAPLEEIESADVSKIVSSSSHELLGELNRKRGKARLWPSVAITSVLLLGFGVWAQWSGWLLALVLLASAALAYAAHARDVLEKTVVLFYDFDSEMEAAYAQLHSAAGQLAGCSTAWDIEAQGKVHDRKYHAGASKLLRRKNTSIRKAEPPYVKTNIETVAVGVGRQTLYFFPDRVLIYDKNGVGAVGYQELRIDVAATQFVEDAFVPRDAEVVRRTWKYVNKSGGADKRFKDNKELPVCLYEEITLSSESGLNEVLQLSRCGFGGGLVAAIALLGRKVPMESTGDASAV